MAAIIKCDACGACVPVNKAHHVRVYGLANAESYNAKNIEWYADFCDACHKKLKAMTEAKKC